MKKCVMCGTYFKTLAEMGYEGQTTIVGDYDDDLYCSQECKNLGRANQKAAQAAANAQWEAQQAAEEAEENAARRAAWPAFEQKYAPLFKDDIPNWFVNLFSINTGRGRYVADNLNQIKEFVSIVQTEKRKADDFLDRYRWMIDRWMNLREILDKVEEARKKFEKAAGIKFDEPLSKKIVKTNRERIVESDNWRAYG